MRAARHGRVFHLWWHPHNFNRYRAEQWDGSHLTLPGLTAGFDPRRHQKDVVWRILASAYRGVLMAHGVGAGKTAAMIIAAQETKRRATARRNSPHITLASLRRPGTAS